MATAVLSSGMYVMGTAPKAMAAEQRVHTHDCQHTWHRRFGHRNINDVQLLQDKNITSGIQIRDCGIREVCGCCTKGKLARIPFPKTDASRATRKLDLVHTDLCGPMQTATPSGKRYYMTMIDDYSRYTEVYFLKNKSEAAEIIKGYVQYTKNTFGKAPSVIRSDNGREYVNNKLK